MPDANANTLPVDAEEARRIFEHYMSDDDRAASIDALGAMHDD